MGKITRIAYLTLMAVILSLTALFNARLNQIDEEITRVENRIEVIETDIKEIKRSIEILQNRIHSGEASYYSEDGCIGCREDLIMKNGERFDENKLTLAMNNVPLNKLVKVFNANTGDWTVARVTDTGGFDKLDRIADLSLATKEAINCTDLCDVVIVER